MGAWVLLRRLLFTLPPKLAHFLSIGFLGTLGNLRWALSFKSRQQQSVTLSTSAIEQKAWRSSAPLWAQGLMNPVGLAAGYDKNGFALMGLPYCGFGFAEIGTVTPEPQRGNTGLVLAREPKSQSLFNRLGLPNDGFDCVLARLNVARPKLRKMHPRFRVLLSIGHGRNQEGETAQLCYSKLTAQALEADTVDGVVW
jgi:dihydroorotate dehydrogenase